MARRMLFVGVNGCKAGWLAVALNDDAPVYKVASEFQAIASAYPSALILVDVPIGLVSSRQNERLCDLEARRVLGPARASSVFPAPCRSAIWKPTYESASQENARQTGRKLSKQSWAIVPKIRQLEEYLKHYSGQGPVVREIHPEVCFWALAGRPMADNKHKETGRIERLGVLDAHFSAAREFVERVAGTERRSVLGTDDVVDAFVGALTGLVADESLRTLPASPEVDDCGLRMEMVYADAGRRSEI